MQRKHRGHQGQSMLRAIGGEGDALTPDHFEIFRHDPRFKNGFLMAIHEFSIMNGQMEQMIGMCQDLIVAIDREVGVSSS